MLKRKEPGKGKGEPAPTSQFGRYRVLSTLGQGAMATVHLAEDPSLNRLVAVKVIHSHLASIGNLLDRFTVEAKTAASLRNPNIVEIFDYGLQDGQQYLVMEYIDGPNLQHVLNLLNGKPLEAEACAAVICQAAEGLMAAEKNNVVHRDIKPENMMFSSEGSLKIADFGIAHINEQNLTQTGSVLGSPSFMSPEQIEGGKPSHQTDMFSLGSVFYYCLTGRKPFSGSNIPTIMRNICDLPHPPIVEIQPEADPALVTLVDTLLSKKPEDRGKGARWLSLQLRAYLNQKGVLDLQERVRTLLQQGTLDAGDRTMVEAPKAEPTPRPQSVSTPIPPTKATPKPTLPVSPLVLGIGGAGALVLILMGIWIATLLNKPEAPAAVAPTPQAAAPVTPSPAAPPIETTPVVQPNPEQIRTVEVATTSTPAPATTPKVPTPTVAPTNPIKPATTGKVVLTIISAPPFSEVFIDSKYVGTTPLNKTVVTEGRHRIQVSHRNFQAQDTTVTLRGGDTKLKFRLQE